MARLCLLAFVVFLSSKISAQISEGTIPIGGSIEILKRNNKPDGEIFQTSISPFVGYYSNNNFGIQGGFASGYRRWTIDNYLNTNGIYEGIFKTGSYFVAARHYFPFLDDYRLFGQLDVVYSRGSEDESFLTLTMDDEFNEFTSKASVGANAWLSETISLEAILKFGFLKNRSVEDRARVFKGPLEFILDVRSYVTDGFGGAARNADEFLAARNWNIAGELGIRHSLYDNRIRISDSTFIDNTSLELWLRPKVGYFIADNFLAGISLDSRYVDDAGVNPVEIAVAPFFRYYIRVTDGLQLVPNFLAVWSYSNYRRDLLNSGLRDRSFQFSPGIGFHVFITEGIGLFANGVMDFQTKIDATEVQLDPKHINQLKFQLGFQYYINNL